MDPRHREAPSPTEDPAPTPSRRGAQAYAGAFEAVLSILVGAGLGYWGDAELGTGPWLLLVGFGFGFATFVVRLSRMRPMVEAEAAEAERNQESD